TAGETPLQGECVPTARGEDAGAGIRTPLPLNRAGLTPPAPAPRPRGKTPPRRARAAKHPLETPGKTLEETMPEAYRQLEDIRSRLERHFRDMQDLEFTIEGGRLWMLQTRTEKRNGAAAIRMAVEMAEEGLIGREEAIGRVRPEQVDELLHPRIDPKAEGRAGVIARGLPAGPGAGTGMIVTTAEKAEAWA